MANSGLKISTLAPRLAALDRPGWVPPGVGHNWDSDPYAYQTEEELMPAGGLHGQLLAYIVELLRCMLKERGLMLLLDVFMLYRDEQGVKQRIAPDLLLTSECFPPPSAYDLDVEPPPLSVVEVTSPRGHLADLEEKVSFYLGLGILAYLVVDAITPYDEPREQIELHLWRYEGGRVREMVPDEEGWLALPEMGLKVTAKELQLVFADEVSGEVLLDTEQWAMALREAESRAEAEAAARRAAEAEIARLRVLLAEKEADG